MPEGSEFQIVALTRVLNLEGVLARGKGEPFSGLAIAVGWSDLPGAGARSRAPRAAAAWQQVAAPELHYLVSDMSKPAPIWVAAADIARQYHGAGGG